MRWITLAAMACVAGSMVVSACDREGAGVGAEGAGHAAAEEGSGENAGAPSSFESPPPAGTRAHCSVMGHDFTVTEDSPRSEYEGRTYVFCCASCKPRFDADPGRYAGG